MTDWLILTATLPSSPSALRVRIWRALKAIGSATLREGVYLLPATAASAETFWGIEKSIREAGAQAFMLTLQARDAEQEAAFQKLFDRTESYMEFVQTLKEVKSLLKKGTDMELRKTLRNAEQQLHDIQVTDFFPGKAYERAANGLATLRRDIDIRLSPGEPSARAADIQRQLAKLYEGKTWATRKRPWVDRLATAWLVLRFVDATARFIWVESPKKCPKSAVGFDFDGATFSHVGDKVTFEVVMHTFGLDTDLTLKTIGALVHYIDIGGAPVDEAPGVEAMVRGLQVQHEQDDALLAAAIPFFDTLYAALRSQQ